jgi:twitching motility two-component system response regulator PilH
MSKKVLVVDDDPDVRLFSVTVLEENGYTPLEAEDGEMGLKMIKAEKPDLVILDVLSERGALISGAENRQGLKRP